MFLIKLYWTKWRKKTHKRDELFKIDNKFFIILIFIKVCFIFILIILRINDHSSGCLSHALRLHISGHLIPFTTHAHLLSTLRRLQSHDNKLNTAFGAGKPLFQMHNTNPFSYFHPWSRQGGSLCDSTFQRLAQNIA